MFSCPELQKILKIHLTCQVEKLESSGLGFSSLTSSGKSLQLESKKSSLPSDV